MRNKETLIGWVLIAVLMIGFIFYQNKKMDEEQKAKKEAQKTEQADSTRRKTEPATPNIVSTDSITSTPAVAVAETVGDTNVMQSKFGAFGNAATGGEKTFIIENDVQKITLTNKGGQIKSVELKDYKTWDKKPLILFSDKTNSLSYQFPIDGNRVIDTKNFYFEPVGQPFTVTGDASKSFTFRLMAGDGKYFEQAYTLKGNSYMFNYDIAAVGLDSLIPNNNNYLSLTWNNKLSEVERDLATERRYAALYYKFNNKDVAHLDDTNKDDEYVLEAPLEWISYKQQFFNTTLFSKGDFYRGKLKSHYVEEQTDYVKEYDSKINIVYKNAPKVSYSFQYYIGPNHFNTLKAFDRDFEEIIKIGPDWWVFAWMKYITRFIIWLFNFFDNMHLNYGIIILLLTLILKLAMHPLTAKSIESAAKMKILAPELAELKEKYGEDQTRMGQEQMKLYQRAGVSPLGGCLPLLLQMPILIAMYNFFPASIELRQQAFLWANDLSSYDSVISWEEPILGISHISLFTVLMTITSVVQAVMNNQMNAMSAQQPGMKYMPYIMPVMLMYVFNSFPAALTYYYLLQNLLGVIHQWVIQRFFIDEKKLHKQIEENRKNPKPKSGWQKKLMDMQSQAEQKAKQRK